MKTCLKLVLSLLALTLPAAVEAQFLYTTNNGAITITGYTGPGGAVAIPSTTNGLPVTSIGNSSFSRCYGLTSVTIPDSVTNIGIYAFYGCESLASVAIPNSVTDIGYWAFPYCSSLTNVVIPDSVTSIGYEAFAFCSSLTTATIGKGVTNLDTFAFIACPSLTMITVDALNSVYSSLAGVLFDKSQTMLIKYPEGKAGVYAFPNSLTNIGAYACESCLCPSLTIPDSVTSIGTYAFAFCPNLTAIYFQGNAPDVGLSVLRGDYNATIYYLPGTTGWGTRFDDDPTALWELPAPYTYTTNNGAITITGYTGSGGAVNIPAMIIGLPVTSIGDQAFVFCSGVTSVAIPNTVTAIGSYAFYQCTNLTSVTIPNTVTNIGDLTFANCTSLTGISIPTSVTSIGEGSFDNCTSLTTVTIPDSVINIGRGAFYYCTNLAGVIMGNSVASLGDYAFYGCSRLTGICFRGNAASLGSSVFSGANNAAVFYLPGTTGWSPTFGGLPVMLWETLVPYNYTIDNGTVTITGYTGPGGAVTIPNIINGLLVTRLGGAMFYNCTSLTSVTIPNGVAGIEDETFYQCTSLTNVTIGKNVTSIGQAAFYGCSSLLVVAIPNGVTNIGGAAFAGCSSLTTLTLPNSVTYIEGGAFVVCNNLNSLYFKGNAPNIGSFGLFLAIHQPTIYCLPGTTGWGPVWAGRPTAVWQPQVQTSDASFGVRTNEFGFNINWASGMVVVVEACTDLANPVWSPLQTNTLVGDSFYFSDSRRTNYPARLYRLRSP